jgi:hypothetical protein
MQSALRIARISAAWIGALTLAGAAVAARAEGTAPPSFKCIEGAVVMADFTAKTLTVHPTMGDNVTLMVGTTTRWGRGAAVFPAGPQPKPHTQAETPPNPDAYIGLYARAQYNPSTMVASYIWLSAPQALHAEGVVHSASATGLSLDLPGGSALQFALDGNTICHLDGQPVSGSALAQGDPVAVTFFLKPTENLSTMVMARTAPPRTFSGYLLPAVQDQAANSFSVKGGDKTLTFTTDDKTQFFLNDKPASFADLKSGQPVFVQYLADGSVFLARRVAQSQKSQGPSQHTSPGTGTSTGKTHEPHPELVAALKALNEAKLHLKYAARDFGGHRAKAAGLTEQAISEVEAAISFDANGK